MPCSKTLNFIGFILLLVLCSSEGAVYSVEQELIGLVTTNNVFGRPVKFSNETIDVFINLEITQLTVSTRDQSLSVTGFFRLKWKNYLVHWNSSEYNNIYTINVDPHLLWYPEIVLHNSVMQQRSWFTRAFKTKISIDHTGTCVWLSPIDFVSTCDFSVKKFPYDIQHCTLTFGPWTDDVRRVNLHSQNIPVVTSQFAENVEWALESAVQIIQTNYYNCCPAPFKDLKIDLVLRRKPSFYLTNSVVPCAFLFILIIVGHRLPPQSGERITLSIMISLTCIVMMEYTNSRILPQKPEISSLGKIFLTLTLLASFSILETCYVLGLHHRPDGMLKWLPKRLEKLIMSKASLQAKSHLAGNEDKGDISLEEINNGGRFGNTRETEAGDAMHDGVDKARLIYQHIRDYNEKVNTPKANETLQLRAKEVGNFLDKVFVWVVVVCVFTAVLLEVFA